MSETAHKVQESALTALATPGAHVVQFYRSDDALVTTIERLTTDALAAGDAVVTIATGAHHEALRARRRASGADVDWDVAQDAGRYTALDADDTLDRVLVHGRLAARRFDDTIGAAVARAEQAAPSGRVRAFGEMVALLCGQGRYDLAIGLEEFWSDVVDERRFSLLCAYPLTCFAASHAPSRQLAVCGWHSHVTGVEGE